MVFRPSVCRARREHVRRIARVRLERQKAKGPFGRAAPYEATFQEAMRLVTRCRLTNRGFAALTLLASGLLGCGSATHTGPEPEVSLADSAEAQAQFRALRAQWISTPLDARVGLESPLTSFVQHYPTDPQGRWARIYLAWISLQRGDPTLARRWLALAETGPAGAASDLLEVVRASLMLVAGQANPAYTRLLELQGRLIDEDDRLLCLDQLVLAALASEHYREAVAYLADLAAQAARRYRERMWRTLEPRLAQIPLGILEESLPHLSTSSLQNASVRPAERAAAIDWLRHEILDLLSRSAINQRNVELAQRLVATASGEANDAEKTELLWLATEGGVTPSIQQRTVGLALEIGDARLRQRSVEVAAGIALTLDLASGTPDAQRITLQTRHMEDAEATSLDEALARLAADGAGLIVAGFEPISARLAAEFSRQRHVPVLLLHEPAGDRADLPASAYVVGSDDSLANDAVYRVLTRRAAAPITLGAEGSPCPSQGDDPLLAPASSASPPLTALLIAGDAHCAESVFMALGESRRRFSFGLGLNALGALDDLLGQVPGQEVWAVGVGRLPRFDGPRDATLSRWFAIKNRAPTWYESLGHDVARLSEAALPPPPVEVVREPARVAGFYARVRQRLAAATLSDAWSSETGRFGTDRRLPREFRAVRVTR